MAKSSSKRAAVVGAAAFLATASSASAQGLRGSRIEKGSGAEEVVVSSVYLSNARPSEEATEKVIAESAPFSMTSYNDMKKSNLVDTSDSVSKDRKRKIQETEETEETNQETGETEAEGEKKEKKSKDKKKKKKDPNAPKK